MGLGFFSPAKSARRSGRIARSPLGVQAYPDAGHCFPKSPGKFCRSARISRVPIEFPQIFQVALEARSFWMNHSFCLAPRIVCEGELRLKFSTAFWPKRIDSGALLLLYARPASRIF